jgi:flagellar hook protein FlgE
MGGTKYIEGPNTGPAEILSANQHAAAIAPGARELSNTDLGGNLIAMLLAENQYRANWRVAGTASELLDHLLALRRR